MKQNYKPNKKIGEYLWNHQDLLGSGAFGKVYKGYHETTNETVAIKEQDIKQITDPYMKQALKNEISIMKTVNSKNVVNLKEVYQTSRHIYMILDFCNGGDLRSFLTKNGKVSESQAFDIMADVLAGFKALVDHGIIHRDVKPENILISDGIHKLADFGLSRAVENFQKGMLQTACGTPLYMAPQILMNENYTTKCDIWSIGLIFYEMLFGNTPWPCRSQIELINNIKKMPVRFPHHATVSEDTRGFIKGCLTLNENKRFGWNDCFNASFLSKKPVHASPKLEKKYTLDDFSKHILTKLQKVFNEKGYSVEEVFAHFDKTGNQTLQEQEFTKLILKIDSNADPKDIQTIFQQVDTDKSGCLSLSEFKKYILETDYEFKTDNEMLENQRAEKLIKRLKDVIIINNLDIDRIFKNFDKSKDSALNFEEFKGVLKTIDDNILDKEALYIFHKFDHDKDGTISSDEFRKAIYDISDEEKQPVNFSRPISSQAQKAINDLKAVIVTNALDLKVIFSNFDTTKTGTLAFPEFKRMISIINARVHEGDVIEIFQAFDGNKDGDISFEEFYKYLA